MNFMLVIKNRLLLKYKKERGKMFLTLHQIDYNDKKIIRLMDINFDNVCNFYRDEKYDCTLLD